jgi:hypothetical protein
MSKTLAAGWLIHFSGFFQRLSNYFAGAAAGNIDAFF